MANQEFNSAKTYVFWDIEDCPIPDDIEACDVLDTFTKALREMGNRGRVSLWAYGNKEHMTKYGYEDYYYVLTSGDEYERRQKVLVEICGNIVGYRREPLNLVLILGDISGQMDFIKAIHLLRSKGHCKVFLVQPPSCSGNLSSTDWLRAGLVNGERLVTQNQTPTGTMGSWMSSLIEH